MNALGSGNNNNNSNISNLLNSAMNVSNSGNNNSLPGKLSMLLTQTSTPDPLHSPASGDGRRPIVSSRGNINSRGLSGGQMHLATMNAACVSSAANMIGLSNSQIISTSMASMSSISVDMPGSQTNNNFGMGNNSLMSSMVVNSSSGGGMGSHSGGLKSPDVLHQSPTEGPGQSPQEKPQSTSNEDGDVEVSC